MSRLPACVGAMTGALRVDRVQTDAALAALAPEWRQLAQAHGEGNPFTTWEWASTWWQDLRARRPHLTDALYVRAFRAPSGELVGVAPLILTRRLAPWPVRIVDSIGADPNLTELRGLIAHPAWEGQVYAALSADLRACAADWDFAWWRGVRDGSAGWAVLQAEGAEVLGEYPNYALRVTGTWEEFRASRPRNVKEALRRCRNTLRREGLAAELEVVSGPDALPAALERFLTLHRARARMRGGVAHRDAFARAASRRFLADVCGRLAARGMVRVFQLRIRGEVVASRLAFAVGPTLYLYFSGFDPAWARHSVMTTVTAEAIRYAFAAGFHAVNLSNGTDVSKTRWRPEQVVYRDAVQVAPGLRSHAAYASYRAMALGLEGTCLGDHARRLLGRQAE